MLLEEFAELGETGYSDKGYRGGALGSVEGLMPTTSPNVIQAATRHADLG